MIKNLTARGNGWHLGIHKNIIKLLGVNPETASMQFKIKNKILYVQEILPDNPDYEKYLIRPFSKKNTGWGFYMPNSILELLDINPETDQVELEIEDTTLIIKKHG